MGLPRARVGGGGLRAADDGDDDQGAGRWGVGRSRRARAVAPCRAHRVIARAGALDRELGAQRVLVARADGQVELEHPPGVAVSAAH